MLQSVTALAFALVAVVHFQHHFTLYPTLLEFYNQEVYSHGKKLFTFEA